VLRHAGSKADCQVSARAPVNKNIVKLNHHRLLGFVRMLRRGRWHRFDPRAASTGN
jgi:hypothetical protein